MSLAGLGPESLPPSDLRSSVFELLTVPSGSSVISGSIIMSPMSIRRLAAAFAAGLLLHAGPLVAQTPVRKVTGPLAVTADSYPFGAADHTRVPRNLKSVGYVEE